jgi:hypothetical protein
VTWRNRLRPGILGDMATFDELAAVVRTRRTHLHVDRDRPVPDELLDQLCELATWAPCHKRTWPWRFAVVYRRGPDPAGTP